MTTCILLVDNGSTRPEATLNLRRLGARLSRTTNLSIHPVSLQHADRIPPSEIEGRPADTFEPFVRRKLSQGVTDFLVLPLLFGNSRALTSFIPERIEALREEFGRLTLRQGEVLCPLPRGEPRLASILCDQVRAAAAAAAVRPKAVVLVDHGSPLPEVTAVRNHMAARMKAHFGQGVLLSEAVMERRPGSRYDFNGPLLEEVLTDSARSRPSEPVILSLLFMSPGRHAGAGGDIDGICRRVEGTFPGFRVFSSPLVGEHPGLIDILQSRLEACL